MKTPGGYEGRRIQRTGGSTFIVSLPKAWVTSRGLTAGDVLLFASRSDGSLTLYTQEGGKSEPTRRSVTVSNDMDKDHLFRLLVAEYIAGSTLLEVRTPGRMSAHTRDVVREFAQHMIGPEILEESAETVVLQDVVGANPLPLPSVIRRMHHMVRAMQADAMAAFSARDPAIAQDVQQRDWEVDRLHWFTQKQVTVALRDQRHLTSLGLTLPECATFLQASRVLERIADHAVRVAEVTDWMQSTVVPKPQVEELTKLSDTARALLDTAVETLFSGDLRGANHVLDETDRLVQHRRKILDNFFSRPGRQAIALAYVLESLERSALYASDLAEIAINHAVERQLVESTTTAPPLAAPRSSAAKPLAVAAKA